MLPIAAPVTTPDAVTVAIAVLLLLHTPPAAASEKAVVDPEQMEDDPLVIVPAAGNGFTVTDAVATAVPQPLVTE